MPAAVAVFMAIAGAVRMFLHLTPRYPQLVSHNSAEGPSTSKLCHTILSFLVTAVQDNTQGDIQRGTFHTRNQMSPVFHCILKCLPNRASRRQRSNYCHQIDFGCSDTHRMFADCRIEVAALVRQDVHSKSCQKFVQAKDWPISLDV